MNDSLSKLLHQIITEIDTNQSQQQNSTQQIQGNHPQNNQTQQSQQNDDESEQMSPSDQKKIADLQIKQSKFNDEVKQIDGEMQKLQEPVRKKIQDLQRKKAHAQQGLGSATDQISSIKKKYNMDEGKRTMKKSELKDLIRETLMEVDLFNRKRSYTPEEVSAVVFNEKSYQGKRLGGYLEDLLRWSLFTGSDTVFGKPEDTDEVVRRLNRLGFSVSQIAGIRSILADLAKPISDYIVKQHKKKYEKSSAETVPFKSAFSVYLPTTGDNAKRFFDLLKKGFVKKISQHEDLLTPEGSPKNAYLEETQENLAEGKKGLSGMKKSSDKKSNTKMKAKDKTLTKTTTPKESTEKKKLPVVKKPKQPSVVKEAVLKIIRDVIAESIQEMAKAPVTFDGKKLSGGITNSLRKEDPKSPTGYSLASDYKTKDGQVVPAGTPVDAPKNTGANYVRKTAPSSNMGRPTAQKNETSSTVTVNVNGKSMDQFNFLLPNGKVDTRPLKTMVDKFFYNGKRPELSAYGLDQSVYDKFEELSNLYVDDALPANSVIDLTVRNVGGDQVLVLK